MGLADPKNSLEHGTHVVQDLNAPFIKSQAPRSRRRWGTDQELASSKLSGRGSGSQRCPRRTGAVPPAHRVALCEWGLPPHGRAVRSFTDHSSEFRCASAAIPLLGSQ